MIWGLNLQIGCISPQKLYLWFCNLKNDQLMIWGLNLQIGRISPQKPYLWLCDARKDQLMIWGLTFWSRNFTFKF